MMYQIITGHAGIQERSESELVILTASARDLASCGFDVVFTDRHAYSQTAEYFSSVDQLEGIDWELLQSRDFRNDPDDPRKKERYQAEALIFKHVPVTDLKGLVCRTRSTQRELERMSEQACVDVRVALRLGGFSHGIFQRG